MVVPWLLPCVYRSENLMRTLNVNGIYDKQLMEEILSFREGTANNFGDKKAIRAATAGGSNPAAAARIGHGFPVRPVPWPVISE
jgi:hypothetical protein